MNIELTSSSYWDIFLYNLPALIVILIAVVYLVFQGLWAEKDDLAANVKPKLRADGKKEVRVEHLVALFIFIFGGLAFFFQNDTDLKAMERVNIQEVQAAINSNYELSIGELEARKLMNFDLDSDVESYAEKEQVRFDQHALDINAESYTSFAKYGYAKILDSNGGGFVTVQLVRKGANVTLDYFNDGYTYGIENDEPTGELKTNSW
jgi:hypothetical protein